MTISAIAQIIAFSVFSLIAVGGGLGMATTMSMFRSGIFLMASFIGVAGLFILLSADLLSLLQVMMYIGGMLVMILFMVLFSHDPGGEMMVGMDMSLVERFFSLGIQPMQMEHGEHSDEMEHQSHNHSDGHGDMNMDEENPGDNTHRDRHSDMQMSQESQSDEEHHNADEHGDMSHEHQGGGMDMSDGDMNHEHQGGGMDMSDGDMNHEHQGGGMDMSDMSMVTPIRPLATVMAILIGSLLVALLLLRPAWPIANTIPNPNSAQMVGYLLMGKYMMAFEGAGLLILTGIFGAVLLSQPGSHPSEKNREARVEVDAPPAPIEDEPISLSNR